MLHRMLALGLIGLVWTFALRADPAPTPISLDQIASIAGQLGLLLDMPAFLKSQPGAECPKVSDPGFACGICLANLPNAFAFHGLEVKAQVAFFRAKPGAACLVRTFQVIASNSAPKPFPEGAVFGGRFGKARKFDWAYCDGPFKGERFSVSANRSVVLFGRNGDVNAQLWYIDDSLLDIQKKIFRVQDGEPYNTSIDCSAD